METNFTILQRSNAPKLLELYNEFNVIAEFM